MATGAVERTIAVAEATVRRTLSGTSWFGLAAAGVLYPLIVVAIASASFSGLDLLAASETLFSALFLPVILLLICLVQGVSLFRGELEDDTLLYPLKRTLPRPALVVGKYLGFLATTLLALLPSALVGVAIGAALGDGPSYASPGLWEAVALMTVLGVAAYGAAFLLLGLMTRSALVIGLVYGFLWETFVSLLPGPIPHYTLVFYLRGIGGQLVPSGALGGAGRSTSIPGTSVGFALFVLAALTIASLLLRYREATPAAAPS